MNFTDDMIREVLFALQHPEVRARHADDESFELTEVTEHTAEIEPSRPSGRHFRDDSSSSSGSMPALLAADDVDVERRLAMVEELSKEDELHTLTRDYIVAATNHVVHKLERAS